jgi:hypothetical protein
VVTTVTADEARIDHFSGEAARRRGFSLGWENTCRRAPASASCLRRGCDHLRDHPRIGHHREMASLDSGDVRMNALSHEQLDRRRYRLVDRAEHIAARDRLPSRRSRELPRGDTTRAETIFSSRSSRPLAPATMQSSCFDIHGPSTNCLVETRVRRGADRTPSSRLARLSTEDTRQSQTFPTGGGAEERDSQFG